MGGVKLGALASLAAVWALYNEVSELIKGHCLGLVRQAVPCTAMLKSLRDSHFNDGMI